MHKVGSIPWIKNLSSKISIDYRRVNYIIIADNLAVTHILLERTHAKDSQKRLLFKKRLSIFNLYKASANSFQN